MYYGGAMGLVFLLIMIAVVVGGVSLLMRAVM